MYYLFCSIISRPIIRLQRILHHISMSRAKLVRPILSYNCLGLFPLPLFDGNTFFEERKTLYHSLGTFMAIAIKQGCPLDLVLNPLLMKLIREGSPSFLSVFGGRFENED